MLLANFLLSGMKLKSTNRVVDVLLYGAMGVVVAAGVAVVLYLLWGLPASESPGSPASIIGEIVCAILVVFPLASRKKRL